jgi:3-oxoacyl-[acyl-carrier-protein] synthase-3
MKTQNAAILGSGIYLPKRIVKNAELEEVLELEPGTIEARTGIKERRWSQDYETVEYMAAQASLQALDDAHIRKVDTIIIARDAILTQRAYSISLPIVEHLKENGIDTSHCFSLDIANYCPGFIHAMNIAHLMVKANQVQNALVVASTNYKDMIITQREFNRQFKEKFDPQDEKVRSFSVQGEYQSPSLNAFLWGCGAGAVVVGKSEKPGIIAYDAHSSEKVRKNSYGIGESYRGHAFAALDGQAIYKYAITEVPSFIEKFLSQQNMSPLEIKAFIPHQPNPRIIKKLSEKVQIPSERILVSCDTLGNMIGASIPITYHLFRRRIKSEETLLMCSFGDSYLSTAGLLCKEVK